jgi:hypothetical protein
MAPFKHKTRSRQVSTQTWRGVLPIHPAAELLPAMTDVELRDLGEDIRKHGQRIPITTLTDQEGVERLLDGRSRLDAMERLGLPIVRDGDLNRDQLDIQNVSGNVDPYAYVLSANIHRRHLTSEQKREVIEKLLKAKPDQSNRTIAKQVKADDKTVGTVRNQLESRSEIPHVKTRIDSKGREQPAKKARKLKAEPEPVITAPVQAVFAGHLADYWGESVAAESEAVVTFGSPCTKRVRVVKASAETETPIAPAEAEQEESDDSGSLAWSLQITFNNVWEAAQEIKNWPELSAARKARLKRAMTKLRAAFLELIDLATPVKRGRPPKAKAGAE